MAIWNPDLHIMKKYTRYDISQAKYFGLEILDWDIQGSGSFRKRINAKLSDLLIPFQYIDEIPKWEKSANYSASSDIIGSFEPKQIYQNSNEQSFSINLTYHAEAPDSTFSGMSYNGWTLDKIDAIVNKLKSLTYPIYTKGYSAPPKVLLNIGSHFSRLPILVKSVSVDNQPPYETTTLRSMLRKISLEVVVSYPAWQTIDAVQIFTADRNSEDPSGAKVFAFVDLRNQKQYNT